MLKYTVLVPFNWNILILYNLLRNDNYHNHFVILWDLFDVL